MVWDQLDLGPGKPCTMDCRGFYLQKSGLNLNIYQKGSDKREKKGLTNKLQDSYTMKYHTVTEKNEADLWKSHMESSPRQTQPTEEKD